MDKDEDGKTNLILEFTVRNDKFRGLLIDKFVKGNDESFFKHHDQPVERHCQEMQRIIRSANVKRTKTIRIDVAEFYYEYFFKTKPTFRGCPMTTSHSQIDKVCALNVNKEIGAIKRGITIAQNKSKKIEEHNNKIDMKMHLAEEKFQLERAKRIHELYGGVNPVSLQTSHNWEERHNQPTTSRSPVARIPPLAPEPRQNSQNEPMDHELPDDDSDL